MKYLALSVALAFLYLTSDVSGLSCFCKGVNCTKPECDNSGYGLDICGCCTVCAKELNQTCGGLWNTDGTCDKNLTCNGTKEFGFASGECSDAECRAIVDFVFVLDGSFEFGKTGFANAIIWAQEIIRRIYEMYGACAHVEVMEYAGVGANKTALYPMNLDLCTNNNDCVERKLEDMTFLNSPGKMTYTTLYEILNSRFPMSSRFGRSQKVIIVATFGDTADEALSKNWLEASLSNDVITYATRVGAMWQELVNITGYFDRLIDPSHVDDFIDQIWRDTVNISETCDFPEEFTPCKSLSCEATCSDMTKYCPLSCDTRGCRCAKGYVRISGTNRTCVTLSECSRYQCPPGEEYFDCLQGCEPTCTETNPGCDGVCRRSGCACTKSHARHNGICIQIKDCETVDKCSYGEVYRNCSSVCTPTCDNPSPICPAVCGPARCQCMTGYVRFNGSCIPEMMCPKAECPPGEIYKQCASACEPTCVEPSPACIEMCMPGKCQCMDGYVRENGECIPIRKCPKTSNCSYGEVFMNCSSMCTPTCDNPYPSCIQFCGQPRCQCKTGYVMHNGTCIPHRYCPSQVTCDYPKVRQDCAIKCQATCDNPNPWNCEAGCSMDPCVCPVDHVLFSETDRRCVHLYECPAKTCMQQCPTLYFGATREEASTTWACHFKKWRCTSYQWKLSVEEWWYSSGCYAVGGDVESRWRRLFECPEYVEITCNDASQFVYDVDAFGCRMGKCHEGAYKDGTQMMKLWMGHQMKYQEKLQLYNEATAMCQRSLNNNCHLSEAGCHGSVASHSRPMSLNFFQMLGTMLISVLLTLSSWV